MKNLWHEHCQRFLSPVYLRRRALFLIIIKNTRQIIRDATAERGTAALMMSIVVFSSRLRTYESGTRTKNDDIRPCAITNPVFPRTVEIAEEAENDRYHQILKGTAAEIFGC